MGREKEIRTGEEEEGEMHVSIPACAVLVRPTEVSAGRRTGRCEDARPRYVAAERTVFDKRCCSTQARGAPLQLYSSTAAITQPQKHTGFGAHVFCRGSVLLSSKLIYRVLRSKTTNKQTLRICECVCIRLNMCRSVSVSVCVCVYVCIHVCTFLPL